MEDSQLYSLRSSVGKVIWVIKMDPPPSSATVVASGFCFDATGLILTSAHHFHRAYDRVQLRRLHDDGFPFEADLVGISKSWNFAVLRIRGGGDFCAASFGEDDDVFAGQELVSIGQDKYLVGSYYVGRSVSGCSNVVIPDGRKECVEHRSTALGRPADFRVLGDIWDYDWFCKEADCTEKFTRFKRNMDPFLPIILLSGFANHESLAGSPVFDALGQVVGMFMGGAKEMEGGGGLQVAIHVSTLKHFLEGVGKSKENGGRSSKRSNGIGQGSRSKKPKELGQV